MTGAQTALDLAGRPSAPVILDRIPCTRGDSIEPAVHDGDRLLVDTGRKTPGAGSLRS